MKRVCVILIALFFSLNSTAQRRMQRDPFDAANRVIDQSELKSNESIDDKIRKNFFLKAEVSKTTCYVGECLMATFKLYSRLNANSRVVKRPSLTGFSVIEMVNAYNNEPEIESINGSAYYVHLIRKVQLFPLQAGTYSLDVAEVESDIYLYKRLKGKSAHRRLRDIFLNRNDDELDSTIVKRISLATPPTEVHVLPLPAENQPQDFSGAVGNFSIDLRMKDKQMSRFEPAIVDLLILGTGNFPLVTDPVISWPAGVHASPPRVNEDLNKYIFPLSGIKSFEYVLDTRSTGNFSVPPVSFSYFDPSIKKYKTASTSSISYTVTADKKAENKRSEKIIQKQGEFPIQYVYFGLIAFIIIGWILFQALRPRRHDR